MACWGLCLKTVEAITASFRVPTKSASGIPLPNTTHFTVSLQADTHCEYCLRLVNHTKLARAVGFPEPRTVGVSAHSSTLLLDKCRVNAGNIWIVGEAETSLVGFVVVANEGSPAAERISTLKPVYDKRPESIYGLAHTFMKECSSHANCMKHEETVLPTRVLEVSGMEEEPGVRLLETKGMMGTYCALSHCWGTHQPLCTTRINLRRHLEDIHPRTLTRTYREAVKFARGIGVKYVWIDSLCILQDDEQDWLHEISMMGSIYGNAFLVIAAAGSKDSSKGLFITKRPNLRVMKLPYIVDGFADGFFSMITMSPFPHKLAYPSLGPLSTRAWATQEWCMARRMVFFMPGGISWYCKTASWDERGSGLNLEYGNEPWISFLRNYAGRGLTFVEDRLVAIQGIVNEMKKTRSDRYRYGVWEGELVNTLLWLASGPIRVDLPGLPSWCWAASGEDKHWMPFPHKRLFQDRTQCASFDDQIPGRINLTGHLEPVQFSSRRVLESRVRFWPTTESQMIRNDAGCYSIEAEPHGPKVFGLAIFDYNHVSDAYCFIAAKEDRSEQEHSRALALLDTFEKEASLSQQANGNVLHTDRDSTDGLAFLARATSTYYVYWALILERISHDEYRRIGLAMLYPVAFDMSDRSRMVDIKLI